MNQDDYLERMHQVYLLLVLIDGLPLDDMRDAQQHAETVGPFVNPTLFIQKAEAFRDDCEATKILADAQRRLRALKAIADARRTKRGSDNHDRQAHPSMRH